MRNDMILKQKIIITVAALVFVVGVVAVFSFAVRRAPTVSESVLRAPIPASEPVAETWNGSPQPTHETALSPEMLTDTASQTPLTSKAEAEQMLVDTESDFQSLDSDFSAQ